MIERARLRRILGLALPIIGAMVSQNVVNLVDIAMVGTLGDEALAGSGMGGFANFFTVAMLLGLGAGVQAMASRRVGEGKASEAATPLNGGLLVCLAVGLPWAVLLYLLAPSLFPLVLNDSAVVDVAVPYYRFRCLALWIIPMNMCFRGFWNATDRSGVYMRTILVMHAVNIFLNWVLIFGNLGAPRLGAPGAGLATAISVYVAFLMYLALGYKHARENGFFKALPNREDIRSLVKLSLPSSVQQLFFAGGMVTFMSIMGHVGTDALAASHVLVHLFLVGILPGIGFGMAAATLVGQSLGRNDPAEAKRWGNQVALLAIMLVYGIALPAVVIPEWVLSLFIHEVATLSIAAPPLRILGLILGLDAAGMVYMNAMVGAGDTKRVMKVSILLQWGLMLPAAYLLGPVLGGGMLMVWCANFGYRLIQAATYAGLFHRGAWASIKV